MKVIRADEEKEKLIFSEKEASWSKFSDKVNVGDIFEARVGSIEDFGAFLHLRFPDGTLIFPCIYTAFYHICYNLFFN